FTHGQKSHLRLRVGIGVRVSTCMPATSRLYSTGFPQQLRARAPATERVGEDIGLAAVSPL
ncbi:MFS transporter, partial [Klebsiella pneumoniae]|nr:MFS transporter [Klebsiella pneumoniae]